MGVTRAAGLTGWLLVALVACSDPQPILIGSRDSRGADTIDAQVRDTAVEFDVGPVDSGIDSAPPDLESDGPEGDPLEDLGGETGQDVVEPDATPDDTSSDLMQDSAVDTGTPDTGASDTSGADSASDTDGGDTGAALCSAALDLRDFADGVGAWQHTGTFPLAAGGEHSPSLECVDASEALRGGPSEVVYEFTAPSDDPFVFSTHVTGVASHEDTVLYALDCDPVLSERACSDDGGVGPELTQSVIALEMALGETILLVVEPRAADGNGAPYVLEGHVATNTLCDAPQSLNGFLIEANVWGTSGTFPTSSTYFFSPSAACSDGGGGAEVAYSFTAEQAGTHRFTLVGEGTVAEDTVLYVLADCGSEATELACNDDFDAENEEYRSQLTLELTVEQRVIVVLETYDPLENGKAYALEGRFLD